jgi:aerobic carbon-monoxide dehydrogenase small subunit
MTNSSRRSAPRGRRGAGAALAAGRVPLRFTVNGRPARVSVPPMKRLLDVLREDLALTGSKEGCGEGECGACSVLLDGAVVNACLVPAVQCEGRAVVTVEGLGRGASLDALQRAFVDLGGAQCGICTPGMLVAAHALIAGSRGRVPSDPEVRVALAGNLCRCTGYQRIVDAVRAAARAAAARPKRSAAKPTRAAATPKRAGAKPQRVAARPRRAGATKPKRGAR